MFAENKILATYRYDRWLKFSCTLALTSTSVLISIECCLYIS